MSRVCIDLGATNIKGSIREDGRFLRTDSTPTRAEGGFESIRASLCEAVEKNLFSEEAKSHPAEGIALSSAGTVDPNTKTIVYATENLPGFTGFAIGEFLEEKYGLPVSVLNDGLAALLGEITVDRRLQNKRVVMLTLGSGVGGAFSSCGKIVAEERNSFCLYGHLVMEENGILCNCGKRGCIEQYLSGRAVNRLARDYGIAQDRIFAEYQEKTPRAAEAVARFRTYLKRALDVVFSVDAFDVCLLGGGAADGMGDAFGEITAGLGYPILRASAGNAAGMIGADAFFTQFYHD